MRHNIPIILCDYKQTSLLYANDTEGNIRLIITSFILWETSTFNNAIFSLQAVTCGYVANVWRSHVMIIDYWTHYKVWHDN